MDGLFTPGEVARAAAILRTGPRHTLLAMHAEPAAGRWASLDGYPVDTPKSVVFFRLLSRYRSKVKHVLVSHVHAYDEQFVERRDRTAVLGQGTDFVVSGGAGAPLDEAPLIYNQYHFLEFSVTRDRVSSPDLFQGLAEALESLSVSVPCARHPTRSPDAAERVAASGRAGPAARRAGRGPR